MDADIFKYLRSFQKKPRMRVQFLFGTVNENSSISNYTSHWMDSPEHLPRVGERVNVNNVLDGGLRSAYGEVAWIVHMYQDNCIRIAVNLK
jgi:hypothetical protein